MNWLTSRHTRGSVHPASTCMGSQQQRKHHGALTKSPGAEQHTCPAARREVPQRRQEHAEGLLLLQPLAHPQQGGQAHVTHATN